MSNSFSSKQIFFKPFFSSSDKQYVSNLRLCIVHLLNAIELTTDLGMILLRTFKVSRSFEGLKIIGMDFLENSE